VSSRNVSTKLKYNIIFLSSIIYIFSVPSPWKHRPEPLKLGPESIADRLKRLRKSRGLTQAKLAEKIGISCGLLASYEYGKNRLFDEMIIRLSIVLRVSTDTILGVKDFPHESFASTRFTKRLKKLEQLPEAKKKVILSNLDDFIRANS